MRVVGMRLYGRQTIFFDDSHQWWMYAQYTPLADIKSANMLGLGEQILAITQRAAVYPHRHSHPARLMAPCAMPRERPLPLLSHTGSASLEVCLPLLLEPVAAAFREPALIDPCVRAKLQFHPTPSFTDENLWELWWAGADLPRPFCFSADREMLAHAGKFTSGTFPRYGRQRGPDGRNIVIFSGQPQLSGGKRLLRLAAPRPSRPCQIRP
ncbi:hypothetical protein BV96_01778 [Sphingomonas paucimobilis]|nr:hypothetical protein BV96_01778 [Sphingomonas paucimobilis]